MSDNNNHPLPPLPSPTIVRVVIDFDPQRGTINASHPPDRVLTFGILEMAKALMTAQLVNEHAPRVVGVSGAPPLPGLRRM